MGSGPGETGVEGKTVTCSKASGWCKDCPNWPDDPFERACAECDAAQTAYEEVPRWSWRGWRRWRAWTKAVKRLNDFDDD